MVLSSLSGQIAILAILRHVSLLSLLLGWGLIAAVEGAQRRYAGEGSTVPGYMDLKAFDLAEVLELLEPEGVESVAIDPMSTYPGQWSEPWEIMSADYFRRLAEEMFADFKGHGFDLQSTQLRSFGRLSRLTLAVAMLYVWLVENGARAIKQGQRRMVDRSDRRDYSVFRLGCNMLDRCLAQETRPSIHLLPRSLPKLSGG
jgi:hypothetical protein